MIFGETDAGELGICVNNTSNRVVIYVAGLAGDDFYAGHSFVFGFVRQHWPGDYIADGINAFHICAEMFLHFDALLFIELHAHFFCAQAVREWAASD